MKKETSPTLNRDAGRELSNFQKRQELGRNQRRVPEVNQSVRIQLPSAEDGERFLQSIRSKNVSVVEQF